jgi:hypothetical protein
LKLIESLGLEYAVLLRRRINAVEELERVDQQILAVQQRILADDTDTLYAPVSREWPQVPDERPTQVMTVPEGWACPGSMHCHRHGTAHVHLEGGQIWST